MTHRQIIVYLIYYQMTIIWPSLEEQSAWNESVQSAIGPGVVREQRRVPLLQIKSGLRVLQATMDLKSQPLELRSIPITSKANA